MLRGRSIISHTGRPYRVERGEEREREMIRRGEDAGAREDARHSVARVGRRRGGGMVGPRPSERARNPVARWPGRSILGRTLISRSWRAKSVRTSAPVESASHGGPRILRPIGPWDRSTGGPLKQPVLSKCAFNRRPGAPRRGRAEGAPPRSRLLSKLRRRCDTPRASI